MNRKQAETKTKPKTIMPPKTVMKTKVIFLTAVLVMSQLTAHARKEQIDIPTPGGTLKAVLQRPDTEGNANVPLAIICHGFTGNKNEKLMRTIADSLETRGIASIRFDFNGHGESYGRQQEMTVPRETEDAAQVFAYARALPYVGKIAIVGHSQGGVVTAMTGAELGSESVGALCLLSPAAVLRDDALRGTLFGQYYNAADPPEEVSLPGGGYTIGRNFILSAQNLPIYETARRYDGPVLIIHGKADIIVPYTYGQRFCDEMRHARICLLEGENHSYSGREDRPARMVAIFLERELKWETGVE